MKIKGVVNVKGLQLPESFPVQAEDISIDYEASFSITELKELLEVAQTMPDVVATMMRKFKAYDEEFTQDAEAHTQAMMDKSRAEVEEIRRQSQPV